MYIDKKSPIPVYYQLKKIVLDKIASGEYAEGSNIPSERELGDILGISRMTVRQALNHLVNEGVLLREKGRGTFVTRPKIEQKNIMSFSETVSSRGMVPSTKVLTFKKEEVNEEIKTALGLNSGEMIYNVRRLRLANNCPIGIEENFIPERYCEGLEKFDLTTSLYKLMKEEYKHVVSYIDNTIESTRPTKEEMELLNISGNTPILKIKGVNYSETGEKLFRECSVYRSDEYRYSFRVHVDKDME